MSASTLDERIQQALDLSEAGDKVGLDQLTALCQEHPDSASAWRARAQAENELGQPDDALRSVNRAIELGPSEADSWRCKAELLLDMERYEDALCALETGLEKAPDDEELWFEKGATLVTLNRPEEALEAFDRLLELDDEDDRALSFRGDMLELLGRFDEACQAYERALEIDPEEARLWTRLGRARLDARQSQTALEALEKAVQLDDKSWEAWSNRGLALCNLDRVDEALKSYDTALELEPANPTTLGNKCVALELSDRLEQALECAQKWTELSPEQPEAWLALGRVYDRMGNPEQAQAHLDKALALNPNVLGPMQVWGLTLVDDEGKPSPDFQAVQVRTNMPPQEVVKQFLQMLLQQGHKVENERVDGQWRIAVFPVQQLWGVGLFDENGQPHYEVQPMRVQTDLPPDQFVGQYIEHLQQQGHKIDESGLVDGKYRVGVFPLQEVPNPEQGVA